MSSLALQLPEALARESSQLAKGLNMSRSEFIRQAVEEKIQKIHKEREKEGMLTAFKAMKNSKEYAQQSKEFEGFDNTFSEDKDDWWTQP